MTFVQEQHAQRNKSAEADDGEEQAGMHHAFLGRRHKRELKGKNALCAAHRNWQRMDKPGDISAPGSISPPLTVEACGFSGPVAMKRV